MQGGSGAFDQYQVFEVDLASFEGENFDPVLWMDEVMRGKPGYELSKKVEWISNTDQHLSSLATALQLRSQDLNEVLEVSSLQIVNMVPFLVSAGGRMKSKIATGKRKLADLLGQMSQADADQQESLRFLAEIDAVKTKLETARRVLVHINEWDFRTREVESLLSAGHLGQVATHLLALTETAKLLSSVSEFDDRAKAIKRFTDFLLRLCKEKLAEALEGDDKTQVAKCSRIFAQLGEREALLDCLVSAFEGASTSAWKGLWKRTGAAAAQQQQAGSSAGVEVDEGGEGPQMRLREDSALLSFFERFSQDIEERASLVSAAVQSAVAAEKEHAEEQAKALKAAGGEAPGGARLLPLPVTTSLQTQTGASPSSASASREGGGEGAAGGESRTRRKTENAHEKTQAAALAEKVAFRCVRAALSVYQRDIGGFLKILGEGAGTGGGEEDIKGREQAVERLMSAFEGGTNLLCAAPSLAEREGKLWEFLRGDGGVSLVPVSLFEAYAKVTRASFALSLGDSPPHHPSWAPSQAVLEAESNAVKVLWQVAGRAEALVSSLVLAPSVPLFVACADEALMGYWSRWSQLRDSFRKTIGIRHQGRKESGAVGVDAQLLQTCLQVHQLVEMLAGPADSATKRALGSADSGETAEEREGEVTGVERSGSEGRFFALEKTLISQLVETARRRSRLNRILLQALEKGPPLEVEVPSKHTVATSWKNFQSVLLSVPVASKPGRGEGEGASPVLPPSSYRPGVLLQESAKALRKVHADAKALVRDCCLAPARKLLEGYAHMAEWTAAEGSAHSGALTGQMPTSVATSVGEHVLGLVSQLDHLQVAGGDWLVMVVDSLSSVMTKAVSEIPRLTASGALQLAFDVGYTLKVAGALGCLPEAGSLVSLLVALCEEVGGGSGGESGQSAGAWDPLKTQCAESTALLAGEGDPERLKRQVDTFRQNVRLKMFSRSPVSPQPPRPTLT
uniref:Conserved oligomeric Golgi complex subunit 7 n=1 Tax=Chromera velia CCMP2878 TaxID=1169474 RepID=A0A0G4GT30_9ALVE|eukprot:Cvel_5169.t1-p1 / transcript=Cvel_5169.t1 / gene=Cvel_5169 / organism=Chromera_velia_CCMP2878 / gene_product=Conserved oligomeric Golgi complex subunit 7, putative / transcript_product=Conserved oligomeric Golgi complex subunit 7, putative / location=Cvel_scaffold237:44957-52224(+) / protein_length=967 / sequence_SO=supercontig / SO=protein_coding / is_pseudo=false